jgi:uncharacterized protein (UPF0332 family)
MIRSEEFLIQAERWIQGPDEVDWRSAVSRAYYAAFHAARDLFRNLGFRVPRAAIAHGYLWMRLSNCGDPSIQVAGSHLNSLQGERNFADYDVHLTFSQADAQLSVQRARSIVQCLAGALVDPVRTQIRDAMRDYERNVLRDVTWQGP